MYFRLENSSIFLFPVDIFQKRDYSLFHYLNVQKDVKLRFQTSPCLLFEYFLKRRLLVQDLMP